MKFYIILICFFAFSIISIAQDLYLGYSFDPWGYEYYSELEEATVSTATGNDGAENINLPFNFPYMGVTYSTARISVNGWLELGQTYTGLGYNNDLTSTTAKPLICPLWDDLLDDEISEIKYKTIGVAPTRQFIIEWKNILISGTRKSFQVRLFEIDGTIAFHYGSQSSTGFFSASIGMNDHIGGTGHLISVSTGQFVTVDTLIANNNIDSFEDLGENTNFYFIPAGKSFYITTYQITDNVIKGAVNQPIIAILVTSRMGVLTMPGITSISLSTNGTTNTNDIVNAKIFCTGTSPYFSTNYQAGNTVNNPNGNFSINGGGGLHDYATNYIWLTYDVSDSAQIGNVLDAECYQLFFDLTFSRSPDIIAPPGSRTIVPGNGLSGSYTVGETGDFISLTSILDSLTETFITGPITIELLNSYNSTLENFPITIPFINGSNVSNTITIRPSFDANDITIIGDGSSILKFDNSIYIKIDGRPGGIGEQKALSIVNENLYNPSILITGNSRNIIMTFSKILGSNKSLNGAVIQSEYNGYLSFSKNVLLDNCFIAESPSGRPKSGIYFGEGDYPVANNWIISKCSITGFTSSGIKITQAQDTYIQDSEIYLTTPSDRDTIKGIIINPGAFSTRVLRNSIHSLSTNLNSANNVVGIEIPFTSDISIYNNFISLAGNEYSSVTGIDFKGEYYTFNNIFYNSIYIYGNCTNSNNSYCFRRRSTQYYSGLMLKIKNNVFINKRSNTQGSGRHYAIAVEDQRGLQQIDYNNYFASGSGTHLGKWLNEDVNDLSTWKSYTQKDSSSISKNVNFISSIDLHLTGSSLGDEDLIAQPNSSVLVDIDNEPRNLYFPYMGADENTDYPLPVELITFTADVIENNVILSWSTASELNNAGFEIKKSFINPAVVQNTEDYIWNVIGFINGKGTTNEISNYSFTDNESLTQKTLYRLKQIDFDGSYAYSGDVEVNPNLPLTYNLEQNYPNPFNSSSVIRYSIPQLSQVTLKIFNTLGEEIATLVNEEKPIGTYELNWNAANLPSGVYFYRLQAGDFVETKKMIYLK